MSESFNNVPDIELQNNLTESVCNQLEVKSNKSVWVPGAGFISKDASEKLTKEDPLTPTEERHCFMIASGALMSVPLAYMAMNSIIPKNTAENKNEPIKVEVVTPDSKPHSSLNLHRSLAMTKIQIAPKN